MNKKTRTSEELLRECDVLLEECRMMTDAILAQAGIKRIPEDIKGLLAESGGLIDDAHLINDAIEGWLGTKQSFKDEVMGNLI